MQDYAQSLIKIEAWEEAEHAFLDMTCAFPGLSIGFAGAARVAQMRGDSDRAALLWHDCLQRFGDDPERVQWL